MFFINIKQSTFIQYMHQALDNRAAFDANGVHRHNECFGRRHFGPQGKMTRCACEWVSTDCIFFTLNYFKLKDSWILKHLQYVSLDHSNRTDKYLSLNFHNGFMTQLFQRRWLMITKTFSRTLTFSIKTIKNCKQTFNDLYVLFQRTRTFN